MPKPNTITQFTNQVHRALQELDKPAPASLALSQLLYYEQLCARLSRGGRRQPASLANFMRRALREFRAERPQEARLLARRFVERETAKEIAHSQAISSETVNRNQRRALDLFAGWLLAQEQEAQESLQAALEASLPPASFARLFGASRVQATLLGHLRAAGAPWVICLTGLGGIGKTSLANQTLRALIPHFPYKHILWLHAGANEPLSQANILAALSRQLLSPTLPARQRLAAVQRALKRQPSLIVLDNLDGEVADAAWVDWLHQLAQPSKFLLCSRQQPAPLARAYNLPLQELSARAAGELLRHQAEQIGLETAIPTLRKQTASIYSRTGGNPLALKLAVGLLHAWSMDMVLAALQTRRGQAVEDVYDSIYRASWQALSQPARRLLLAMPLVGVEGATPAQLKAISGLAESALHNAIHELHTRSLLEAQGNPQARRYSIHQLTRSFVRKEILNES